MRQSQDLAVLVDLVDGVAARADEAIPAMAALQRRLVGRHRAAHAKAVALLTGPRGLRRLRSVLAGGQGTRKRLRTSRSRER
jgi:hypothetical protein